MQYVLLLNHLLSCFLQKQQTNKSFYSLLSPFTFSNFNIRIEDILDSLKMSEIDDNKNLSSVLEINGDTVEIQTQPQEDDKIIRIACAVKTIIDLLGEDSEREGNLRLVWRFVVFLTLLHRLCPLSHSDCLLASCMPVCLIPACLFTYVSLRVYLCLS